MLRSTALIALLCLTLAAGAAAAAAGPDSGAAFLQRLAATEAAGELTADEALFAAFAYGFAPDRLPEHLRPAAFSPLKCGTDLIVRYLERRDAMPADLREQIETWLKPKDAANPDKATYVSPGGHFTLTYSTTGTNAVPATDTSPANGIPDYVEKVATYCDYSWSFEIDTLGFTAPPIGTGTYQIAFEAMGYYGYTSPVASPAGASRITLHNTFLGFPPNTDPEGNQWGAAKVTVAHEFKHASQRAGSLWSESGWVELDATWMEDAAYDAVNDYYNYLPSGSPISSPSTGLDNGGSGGSYEDCVWQHWMTETWDNQIVVDFWNWRKTHQGEAVMTSYNTILGTRGSSVAAGWPAFTAWNYATGTRAVAGFGYGEAANYPTGPVTTISSWPGATSGTVAYLAASFVRCLNLTGQPGALHVVFTGGTGAGLRLTAVIGKTDGTTVSEPVVLDAANDANANLSVPLNQIALLGFVVGNGATSGSGVAWTLNVEQVIDYPDPALSVSSASVGVVLEPEAAGTASLGLTNSGDAGSTLDYAVVAMAALPARAGPKNITGANIVCSPTSFVPGTSASLTLTVTNPSTDGERLTSVTVDFPPGITVTASTNFVGGTGGDLVTTNRTGDGAAVVWTDRNGGYGNIYGNGQQAVATVSVTFGAGWTTPATVATTINGDGVGGTPHTVTGSFQLTPPLGPTVTVVTPNGGELWPVGASRTIAWNRTGDLAEVKLQVSRDSGASWETIVAATANDGSEAWTVTGPADAACRVRVASADETVADASDADFAIYEPVPWLAVSPLSGSVAAGATETLTLAFDAAGLPVGVYDAVLLVTHSAAGSPAVVPVELTVRAVADAGDAPLVLRLHGNHPNPFNPATTIAFTLPSAGPARLEVLDLQGRRVRTLTTGELTAGPHEVAWDGRDDGGRAVPSGGYLLRLTGGGQVATAKATLAK